MDSAQLVALVAALKGRRVAVIGDVVADEFVYGRVARVSREAPVLILEYDSTEVVPGAGGNAANNAAALGADVTLASLVGTDDPTGAGPGRPARAGGSALRGSRARRQHAGEDADPGRRRAFRQAAGGADRQGRGRGDRCQRALRVRAPGAARLRARRCGAGVGLRVGAGDAAAGERAARRDSARRPGHSDPGGHAARPAAVHRADGVHARTSRRWSRRWASASTTTCGCSSAPVAPCSSARATAPC